MEKIICDRCGKNYAQIEVIEASAVRWNNRYLNNPDDDDIHYGKENWDDFEPDPSHCLCGACAAEDEDVFLEILDDDIPVGRTPRLNGKMIDLFEE